MYFCDEFEYNFEGNRFFVEVEGQRVMEEGRPAVNFFKFIVMDEYGDEITDEHDAYSEIKEEATYREYEEHNSSFDYYNDIYEKMGS